jgi:predicted outer membrane repeat protein
MAKLLRQIALGGSGLSLALVLVYLFIFLAAYDKAHAGYPVLAIENGTIPSDEPAPRPVRFVVPDGLSSGDCRSWESACQLDYALMVASNDEEIWVQTGIYAPAGSGRNATFFVKNGLAVYGGFSGTENQRSQRNPSLYHVVFSGDLGNPGDQSDNAYHVVTVGGGSLVTILEGVRIESGVANGSGTDSQGGGLYLQGGILLLRSVRFESNRGNNGGGLYVRNSHLTLENVHFNSNSVAMSGGALYNYTSALTLTAVSFEANNADLYGGAIYNRGGIVTIESASFLSNRSQYGGAGIYSTQNNYTSLRQVNFFNNVARYYGGAIYTSNSSLEATNTEFISNTASFYGGAIYLSRSRNAETFHLTRIIDTNITGNSSNNSGGAVYASRAHIEGERLSLLRNSTRNNGGAIFSEFSAITLTVATATQNTAKYGGVFYNDSSTVLITNGTAFSNTATIDGGVFFNDGSQTTLGHFTAVGNVAQHYGGFLYSILDAPTVYNSIIWNNTAEKGGAVIGTASFINTIVENGCPIGVSCINVSSDDPLLGIPGNYGGTVDTIPILTGSPAIDRADNSCVSTDARGIARPQGIACDLGAYETRGFALSIVSGNGQAVEVYEPYPDPLVVSAVSLEGHAVDGAQITFLSATDAPGVIPASQTRVLVNGLATATVTANPFSGPFQVEVRAPGSQPIYFDLHNRDAPLAGLRASHSNRAAVGAPALFTATVDSGTNVIFEWGFGDGSVQRTTSNVITHTYTVAGSYPVTLTAFNESSQRSASLPFIEIYDVALAGLTATSDAPTVLGRPTQFWASITEGTGVYFTWDFGDGERALGDSVVHTYAAPGIYTVTLTAQNGVSTSSVQIPVRVEEELRNVVLLPTEGARGMVGQAVTFAVQIGAGQPTTITWRFGDEAIVAVEGMSTSNQPQTSIEHIYASPGLYQVTVEVANFVSRVTLSTTAEITDVPIAGGTIEWRGVPEVTETLEFIGRYAQGSSVRCIWDFDDATQPVEGCEVVHAYQQAGQYTVKLWLINSASVVVVRTGLDIFDPGAAIILNHWIHLPYIQSGVMGMP